MSPRAQSYPQRWGYEVPPNVANRHPSSTGVESDVESRKCLQIRRISSPVSTRCSARDTLLCSPLPRAGEEWYRGVDRPIELTAETLWNEVAGRLKGALNETTYRTWFAEAEGAELSDDAFILGVPNDFTREWIESHFLGLIGAAVRDVTGQERRVALSVTERIPADTPIPAEIPKRPGAGAADTGMNPKYTFDLFVIGSSNRFAHAAALAVAEAPAQAYNPLFIYGGTGLGKTHLMQAIAQYVAEHSSDLSVRYVTSETFMNDFINSLRDKRIEGFKQRYRTYDLLLVDDVQFFEHKERLRSRFEWGLITDVQPPDLETRIAMLRKKVKTDGIHVADPQVLSFIASRISTNIRELEGALTRVVAFSSLTGRALSVELAKDVLKDVFPQGEAAEVSIRRIQELVSERFQLSMDELCGDKRSQNIVYPRQVAMYLSRELTDSSLPKIGKEFGGRDHTTVIHATSKIARLIREDRSVYNLVQELTARVKQVR